MSSLQNQYNLIKEGKGNKDALLRESKRMFPNYIPNSANYNQAVDILKSREIINEHVIGLQAINQIQPTKKENFETAFEKFLAEETKDAKATERKQSKLVDEPLSHQYPYQEKDRLDNQIFDQIMSGYYTEMKDPKNTDKTEEELKAIVLKNLEKDPLYYTKEAQFGIKGIGYRDDVPGAGLVKEPTGKYKASGYGDLKESKEILKENKEIEFPEGLETHQDFRELLSDRIPEDIFSKMTSYERNGLEKTIKQWIELDKQNKEKTSFKPSPEGKKIILQQKNVENIIKKYLEGFYKRINFDYKEHIKKENDKRAKAYRKANPKKEPAYSFQKMKDDEVSDALDETVNERYSMPSEELLSLLDDMLEDLVDTSVDAEQAVKKVISRNPALKHYETALLQLAEPKFP